MKTFTFRYYHSDDASILQYLISSGADINLLDDNCFSPLHYACSRGNLRVVQALTACDGVSIEVGCFNFSCFRIEKGTMTK